jgi:hypothetical protein
MWPPPPSYTNLFSLLLDQHVKDKADSNKPLTEDDVQGSIQNVRVVSAFTGRRAMCNVLLRCNSCLRAEGQYCRRLFLNMASATLVKIALYCAKVHEH